MNIMQTAKDLMKQARERYGVKNAEEEVPYRFNSDERTEQGIAGAKAALARLKDEPKTEANLKRIKQYEEQIAYLEKGGKENAASDVLTCKVCKREYFLMNGLGGLGSSMEVRNVGHYRAGICGDCGGPFADLQYDYRTCKNLCEDCEIKRYGKVQNAGADLFRETKTDVKCESCGKMVTYVAKDAPGVEGYICAPCYKKAIKEIGNADPAKCWGCGHPAASHNPDCSGENGQCTCPKFHGSAHNSLLRTVRERAQDSKAMYGKRSREKHGGKLADCDKCAKVMNPLENAGGKCMCGHDADSHDMHAQGKAPCSKCKCATYTTERVMDNAGEPRMNSVMLTDRERAQAGAEKYGLRNKLSPEEAAKWCECGAPKDQHEGGTGALNEFYGGGGPKGCKKFVPCDKEYTPEYRKKY